MLWRIVLTAIGLIGAWVAIRNKSIRWHRRCIRVCVVLGAGFLISYILYHLSTPSVLYGDVNHNGVLEDAERALVAGWRGAYLGLLLSHILLAMFVVWLVLLSLFYAKKRPFQGT